MPCGTASVSLGFSEPNAHLHSDHHELHPGVRLGVLQHGLEVADDVHGLVMFRQGHGGQGFLEAATARNTRVGRLLATQLPGEIYLDSFQFKLETFHSSQLYFCEFTWY